MRSFVLLCMSQLFSACTGDVFTLGHADAQLCTMYNCFFVRLAATIMHVPMKHCLHDVTRKRVGSEFRAQRRKAPGACVCCCLLWGLGCGGTVGGSAAYCAGCCDCANRWRMFVAAQYTVLTSKPISRLPLCCCCKVCINNACRDSLAVVVLGKVSWSEGVVVRFGFCLCGSELVWGSSQIVAVAVDCLFPVVSSLWFCVWF